MALDGSGHISVAWPCDCTAQIPVIKNMLTDIEAQDTLIRSKGKKQLQIFAKNPPSVAQWQTQWILKGNTLPIPNGVECLWFDTTHNTYGAQYYSVNGSVYPTEMLRYRGLNTILNNTSVIATTTAIGSSTLGLAHWDITGVPSLRAFQFIFNIPTQLLGKNYFVKFYIPFVASIGVNWTIWYENTNFYNTLFGGAGEAGFGIIAAGAAQCVIDWVAEIPAGGAVSTIEVRVAATSSSGTIGLGSNFVGAGSPDELLGRISAEFILKTE